MLPDFPPDDPGTTTNGNDRQAEFAAGLVAAYRRLFSGSKCSDDELAFWADNLAWAGLPQVVAAMEAHKRSSPYAPRYAEVARKLRPRAPAPAQSGAKRYSVVDEIRALAKSQWLDLPADPSAAVCAWYSAQWAAVERGAADESGQVIALDAQALAVARATIYAHCLQALTDPTVMGRPADKAASDRANAAAVEAARECVGLSPGERIALPRRARGLVFAASDRPAAAWGEPFPAPPPRQHGDTFEALQKMAGHEAEWRRQAI